MTTKPAPKVVACVPAYNEEKTIAKVLVRASRHVDRVIVVDDGSEDDTGLIAEKLGAHVIRHSQNLGKGAGMRDFLDWAKKNNVDILVTLDADGQHDPDEIPNLIHPIVEGETDIVIGSRKERPLGMSRRRRLAQRMLDRLGGVKDGQRLVDTQSGFRAYSRTALSSLKVSEWGMGAESEIIMEAMRLGLRISQIPVHMKYEAGSRRRNPLVHFTDVVSSMVRLSLERRPLRVLGAPGFLLLLVGLVGWLDVLATYNARQGFALGHALVYTTVLLTGIFMTIAAMLLFVVRMAIQETR